MAAAENSGTGLKKVHSPFVRITHWLNAIAIVIMIGSGWRIYNNVPIFSWLVFPEWATLGGDPEITYKLNKDAGFSNALLWHFAAMWLFVVNGLVYFMLGVVTGRFRRKLLPLDAGEVVADARLALRGQLTHDDIAVYNALQKLFYIGVIVAGAVVVLSGLAMWKPVQLWWLAASFGGYEAARYVHFFAMAAIVAFIVIHVVMAFVVPKALRAMIIGR
jgi:thiosulfate reductase cytochrome b subunit